MVDFNLLELAFQLIAQYGLLAIFILLVMDGALLLPVFPGELVLIFAVAQYATDLPSLGFVILLTTGAGMVGSLLLYGVTRAGGRRLVDRYPRLFMMSKRRRERLERTFQRPTGQSLVFFLRLFPMTRVLVNIPAGLARMPFLRFFILSAVGMLLFHAGFLFLAYEFRRPESEVATQAALWQEAYASPAWAYVQANAILAGAAVLALGVILSLRASMRMRRDPEETTGSLIGTLATAALFWGGLAVGVGLYLEPDLVYRLIELGGLDLARLWLGLPYEPASLVGGAAALAVLLALLLRRVRAGAKRRRLARAARQKQWERVDPR